MNDIEIKLIDVLEYLKNNHPNLPNHIFEDLGEIINDVKNLNK